MERFACFVMRAIVVVALFANTIMPASASGHENGNARTTKTKSGTAISGG